jgi:AcrR family transcriptional regulator
VGNREDLLEGAKRCLLEKGYASTTARDIAAASGVSLAAIGYHFGSKDALMNQAIHQLVGEWAGEARRALRAGETPDAQPLRRFESVIEQTIDSLNGPRRGLWAAQLELLGAMEHNEELRAFLAGVQRDAATGLAALFLGSGADTDAGLADQAGPVLHALFIGVIVKWFLDPGQRLSARQLTEGMRVLAAHLSGAGRTAPR